ncbi:MAG: T9SS type A sorting domain-containing protein [Bacteroidales bacterium]|nr:T9SS type A sorting domain-containing protein [Bacteroidales bacterium]
MKRLILTLSTALFFLFAGKAQTTVIFNYEYDDAGNRVSRTCTTTVARSATKAAKSIYDSQLQEVDKSIKDYPDNIGDVSLLLYPNPTMGELVIKVENLPVDNPVVHYSLINLSGQVVWKKQTTEQFLVVDLTANPSGEYILILKVNSIEKRYTVIKK